MKKALVITSFVAFDSAECILMNVVILNRFLPVWFVADNPPIVYNQPIKPLGSTKLIERRCSQLSL